MKLTVRCSFDERDIVCIYLIHFEHESQLSWMKAHYVLLVLDSF